MSPYSAKNPITAQNQDFRRIDRGKGEGLTKVWRLSKPAGHEVASEVATGGN